MPGAAFRGHKRRKLGLISNEKSLQSAENTYFIEIQVRLVIFVCSMPLWVLLWRVFDAIRACFRAFEGDERTDGVEARARFWVVVIGPIRL